MGPKHKDSIEAVIVYVACIAWDRNPVSD